MRFRTMAAFAAGVILAAGSTALATTKVASIIGPDNQIHGCYLTSAGLLRVVAAGTTCRDGESAIAWSATGSGAQGPKGDAGVAWRGTWVSGQSYNGGDLVRSAGKVWIRQSGLIACLVDRPCSNTIAPAGAAGWSVFATDGSVGPAGPKGEKGDPAPSSTYRVHTVTVSTGTSIVFNGNGPANFSDQTITKQCPAGTVVTGGGYTLGQYLAYGPVTVLSSHAAGDSGWTVRFVTNGLFNGSRVSVWATCTRLD